MAQYTETLGNYALVTSAAAPASCWGTYYRIGLLRVAPGTVPTRIDTRARGVEAVLQTWERLHVGSTHRGAYQRALAEARETMRQLYTADNIEMEYTAIKEHYGDKRAERSKQPYIKHIDEGLVVLNVFGATRDTMKAWCLHPLFQIDAAFLKSAVDVPTDSVRAVMFATEYRAVANACLPDSFENGVLPRTSPLEEVNMMLVADKVQNYNDVLKYQKFDPRFGKLCGYFDEWLRVLRISSASFQYLRHKIDSWR